MNVKKCSDGWVLVRIDDSNEWIKIGEDKRLYLDTSFEPEKHAQTTGVVVTRCENPSPKTMYKGVPIEIIEGDTVVFYYLTVRDALVNARLFQEDDGFKYLFIPYESLFYAIRDGRIIPLNGYVLVEPLVEKTSSSLIYIPEEVSTKISMKYGRVKYLGSPVLEYNGYPENDEGLNYNPGDLVVFKPEEAIPVKYEMNESKILYRTHRIFIENITGVDESKLS